MSATVRQFVEREYLDHVRTNLAPGRSARYISLWGTHVRPAFGATTLREVKVADVQKFADRRLRAGASPASVLQ